MTVQVRESIEVAHDTTARIAEDGARRSTVTTLVLSTAALLIGLATFVLGQWTSAADGTHLVDTADCRVIAVASAESFDSSSCDGTADRSTVVGESSLSVQPATSTFGPSHVMAAPGLWIHSILRSVG